MQTTRFFQQLFNGLNHSISDAQLRRFFFVYGFSAVGIVLLPALGVIYLAIDAERLRWLAGINIAIAALGVGNLAWLHRHRKIRIAENVTLALLFIVLSAGLFGGLDESGPYWLAVFPPVALFLKKLKVGLLVCTTLIFSLIALTLLQHAGAVQTVVSTPALLMLIGSLTTLTAIVGMSRAILADTETRLEKRGDDLSREILERHSVEALLRKSEARIRFMANRDTVTALPNGALCHDRLEQALLFAQRHHHTVSILLFDIDDFSEINSRYGTEIGDAALREIGQRLRSHVRACDTVGRVGVDEFLVIATEIESPDAAAGIAAKLQQAIAEPVAVGGYTFKLSASAGYASYPVDADQPGTLLEIADARLFAARASGADKRTEDTPTT